MTFEQQIQYLDSLLAKVDKNDNPYLRMRSKLTGKRHLRSVLEKDVRKAKTWIGGS